MRVLTAITDKVAKDDVFTEEVGSITVRVHDPVSRVGHVPAFLWIHDGGFDLVLLLWRIHREPIPSIEQLRSDRLPVVAGRR